MINRKQVRLPGAAFRMVSLALLALLVTVGCGKDSESSGKDQGKGKDSKKTQTVQVAEATKETVTDYVELVGRTSANELVDIRSRVSGFLLKRHFADGQQVHAGDLLFTIEPDQYEAINDQSLAQIEVAKAQVQLAEKTFARSASLLKQNAVSEQEYEQNEAQVATAKAQLLSAQADAERTQLDVTYTKITSPIDGRVDRRLIDEGNYVTGGMLGGTVLTTVINDQPIKALANVDESTLLEFMRRQRDVAGDKFKEADKIAELNIPCYLQLGDEDDFPHKGKIEYAEIRVNEGTGTSLMRAVFDNKESLLKVGMFVRLRVPVTDAYPAVLVPDRAIGTDQATKFVYIVNDKNKVEQRQVETGDRKGDKRVIKSGVKPGEKVVTAGLQLIQPGMEVKTETKAEAEKKDGESKDDKSKDGKSDDDKSKSDQPKDETSNDGSADMSKDGSGNPSKGSQVDDSKGVPGDSSKNRE